LFVVFCREAACSENTYGPDFEGEIAKTRFAYGVCGIMGMGGAHALFTELVKLMGDRRSKDLAKLAAGVNQGMD
jgi:hypothetical protein